MTDKYPVKQAKQRDPSGKFGKRGEAFVTALLREMDLEVTPTGDSPSVDAHAMLHDGTTNLHFAVQVKTGRSYLQSSTGKYFSVRLDRRDITDWKNGGHTVVVVWVDADPHSDQTSWVAYWAPANSARNCTIRFGKRSRLDRGARSRLTRILRLQSGRHGVLVRTPTLFPSRVSEIKNQAWDYFSQWRLVGSASPTFGNVAVTLRSWRHLTRVSRPQREIIHKLALLPCAKEIIESQIKPEFRRKIDLPTTVRELYVLCGRQKPSYRNHLIMEVVVELSRQKSSQRKLPWHATFLSVYEKRL